MMGVGYVNLILLVLCFLVGFTISLNEYYWRDYSGTVPHDAYIAGKDTNGQNIYIGQVAVQKHTGIYPAVISPGKKVVAAKDGAREAWNFAQKF
ncbi:uncharacterized protein LOC115878071 isoform X2 [Sitophilus oryzae]|uniref:Uncharacterized protein LOC115878071 isoform X2 n=1 Tax=Sitophilus oryzae TaxID=7048 RepID=A0A6J2XG10_SITOR|nr:uncharacterized protein LOC115878071 isoform X2 [Sitophilus oryzae]